jgi:hypothetical protein
VRTASSQSSKEGIYVWRGNAGLRDKSQNKEVDQQINIPKMSEESFSLSGEVVRTLEEET